MNFIHDYFQKHGIGKKDIPKAFIIYKGLGSMIGVGFMFLCYRYRPLQMSIKYYPFNNIYNRLVTRYPNFYKKSTDFVDKKSKALANWKYFKPIPQYLNMDPQRTTIAIGETFILEKLASIVTVPFKFWIVVQWLKDENYKPNKMDYFKDSYKVQLSKKSVRHGLHPELNKKLDYEQREP